ncbi:MAG: glycosyltransferase [Pseudobutyrivibrio sp.]|nr:glycosyltransferase [Pseudobutyrivibrio sp.]
MKVSVLVPIYNVSKYLDKCLESLHQQSLQDMEILCLNDGSTDNSLQIINRYASLDSRFKVIDKQNTGYGDTINVGCSKATGQYIAIVESDDYVETNMMEKLYDKAISTNADIVKSSGVYFFSDESETVAPRNIVTNIPFDKVIDTYDFPAIFLTMPTIWTALYKREMLTNNGVKLNDTPGASFQDVSFLFQAYSYARRLVVLPESYYHYRQSNPYASSQYSNKLTRLTTEFSYTEKCAEKIGTDIIKQIYNRFVFMHLLANYNDAPPNTQLGFLVELQYHAKKCIEYGCLDPKYWDQDAINILNEIVENRDNFFERTKKKIFDERLQQLSINCEAEALGILETIKKESHVYLYGAGEIGREILGIILKLGIDKNNISFLVSNSNDNPECIDGVSIMEVDKVPQGERHHLVIATVKESDQYTVLLTLTGFGFNKNIYLTKKIRSELLKIN